MTNYLSICELVVDKKTPIKLPELNEKTRKMISEIRRQNYQFICSVCDEYKTKVVILDHDEYYFCICENCANKIKEKFCK